MIVLDLPMPPSLNSIWRYGRGRAFLSKSYRKWKDRAGKFFMASYSAKNKLAPIKGPFKADIVLSSAGRRANSDCDNRAKAPLDFLQHLGLIENDKLCEAMTIGWGDVPKGLCRITLTPVGEKA